MKIALVAIAKDEDNYLREWLDYHFKIGFDDAYVYCNNWQPHIAVPKNTHLIDWPGEVQQLNAYNDFISKFSKDYDWALFIDVDEFFVPNQFKDAKEAFAYYKDYYGIGFNWKLFGSNGLEKADYSKGVIERFTKSQNGLNKHIKTAINFKKCNEMSIIDYVRFCNPHFVGIAIRYFFTMRADLMKYVMGPFSEIDMFSTKTWDKPYIAHYITKSKEEFLERRSRVRADTNSARSNLEGFWNEHNLNEVDNFDVVKFAGGPTGS